MKTRKTGKAKLAAISAVLMGTMALVLMFVGLTAGNAAAATDKGSFGSKSPGDLTTTTATVGEATSTATSVAATATSTPAATATPRPGHTPLPIKLRPWLQFGHAPEGGHETYHKFLVNHLDYSAPVSLTAASLRGWDTDVSPTDAQTLPGYANVISVTVNVPREAEHHVDIERVRATLQTATPFTTTAYMITINRRHPFNDLSENNWADDPVQYLLDQGVISGYADNTFRPNENVTRAQFAKMLVGAMGWSVTSPAQPSFNDVTADNWAYGYIETAASHGVLGGYADGTFRPNAPLTRAQVAKMIFIARGWTLDTPNISNFKDVSQGDWSYNYIQGMSSAEVMSGYEDNTFRPNAPATRAQVAKILTYALYSDPNQ